MNPYDEQQAYVFLDGMIDLFAQAGRIPSPVPDALRQNLHGMIFIGRFQRDVDEGMSYPDATVKHLAEVRAGLGLQPQAQPNEPTQNPNHVGPGPLTEDRAKAVVLATANEFPALLVPHSTDDASVSDGEVFILRVIWHLHLAGFAAARQKNPSGAISQDKVCVQIDGAWQVRDILSVRANTPADVHFDQYSGANPIPDAGLAD